MIEDYKSPELIIKDEEDMKEFLNRSHFILALQNLDNVLRNWDDNRKGYSRDHYLEKIEKGEMTIEQVLDRFVSEVGEQVYEALRIYNGE